MPTPTYDLIEEKVLSSAAPSVVFNSIVGTYKDLELEIVSSSNSGTIDMVMRFNGDTGSNYSWTEMQGNGTTATSSRQSNQPYIYLGNQYASALSTELFRVFSYANTNVHKTVLGRYGQAGNYLTAAAATWRSTSAITTLTVLTVTGGANFAANTTFRLWGVAG